MLPNQTVMKKSLSIAVLLLVLLNACKKADQPVWMLKLKSRSYTTPMIHKGRFYVFSQAGEVICGDVKLGTTFWTRTVQDAILGDPALSEDGTLFAITQNGLLFAINAQSGDIRWRTEIKDTFIAPVTLMGPMLLLPSETGTLYARSSKDGSAIWNFSGAKKFNAAAVALHDYILVGGWAKEFYCLRLDGSLNWKVTVADRVTNPGVISANTVIFPAYDHFIYSLDVPSGRMLWRYPAKIPSNVVLQNAAVFFSSGRDLLALAASSGKVVGRRPFGGIVNRLYVDSPDILVLSSYVYKVDPALQKASTVIRGRHPIFKLSSAEGMLLACDDLYSIYGYGKPVP